MCRLVSAFVIIYYWSIFFIKDSLDRFRNLEILYMSKYLIKIDFTVFMLLKKVEFSFEENNMLK